ncbi:MAG TPA: hypothetical protein PLZ10_13565, partial [Chitinophagaceae bacterium]|nr:hypothetical protein [Chitinophagaceae bacterium]
MRISRYEIFSAKAKLSKPIADATHTLTEISFLVLRLHTDNGNMGESYLLSFQYSPNAILGALKDQGDLLIGELIHQTVHAFSKLNHANEYFG